MKRKEIKLYWSWGLFTFVMACIVFNILFNIIVERHFDTGWKYFWFTIPMIMAYMGGRMKGIEDRNED